MSLFVISDLHLSIGSNTNKPMEVFGGRWKDHKNKIEYNWRKVITDNDDVIIAGDISWALKLEESADDLKFIDSLPGTKYIAKGNHDFWWSTSSKMQQFFSENDIKTVKLLYNNAYRLDDVIVCGTRGWFTDKVQQNTVGDVEYEKIVNREVQRLKISLDKAVALREKDSTEIIVFMHFPPVFHDFICRELVDVLHQYGITRCYFGHIHGVYNISRCFTFEGIEMILTSADFLDFAPLPVDRRD